MTMSPNPSCPPPPSPWRTASPSLHRQFVTELSGRLIFSLYNLGFVNSFHFSTRAVGVKNAVCPGWTAVCSV
ncbi:hypothetical protein BDA96_10G015900 [Sorghum bicolor]|uniref:Uncharacterized protein n=1 Tax=Sorghum bicolor TaxID=4558 RepID=A0A921Q2A1_SORBI|nr:hypothetical protein BDA96_10G015900 [Sorghum bicolor]